MFETRSDEDTKNVLDNDLCILLALHAFYHIIKLYAND